MSFLVTNRAPDFSTTAVMRDGEIRSDISLLSLGGEYTLLLFYPLDFTFVCPTEILAFDERMDGFEKRGCAVVGISVDSPYAHVAWRKTPVAEGGIGPVRFPLVSDMTREISRAYGVLFEEQVALRGLFLIDPDGIVRHAVVNDQPFGRNVEEAIRMLDAVRFHKESGEVCPAKWKMGEAGMKPSSTGVVDYLSKYATK